jgi:anti-anti-sigma regulatory factor
MEFKIYTKTSYSILNPVINRLDANLTAALRQKWEALRQSGSYNLIIDMHNCLEMDNQSLPFLYEAHKDIYSSGESLVFINLQDKLLYQFKQQETDMPFNIAPTMAEAIDIISMEILERDLFHEES